MFRNTEHIYAVYRERSFSKAAEKMHISQPALSAAVRKEEEEIGAAIFDRSSVPLSLTPFGTRYIAAIEEIRNIKKSLGSYLDDMKELQRGSLSIGASILSVPWTETDAIARFKKKHPGITLKVNVNTAIESKQMLDRGELDLIITDSILDSREYERFHAYTESLVLCVPSSNKENDRFRECALDTGERTQGIADIPDSRCVDLSSFSSLPFVLLSEKNYLRTCTDALFMESGFSPAIAMEVEHSVNALVFSSYGIGATIVSNLLTRDSSITKELCIYRIRSDKTERNAFIYTRKGIQLSAAAEAFIREFGEN